MKRWLTTSTAERRKNKRKTYRISAQIDESARVLGVSIEHPMVSNRMFVAIICEFANLAFANATANIECFWVVNILVFVQKMFKYHLNVLDSIA